MQPSIRWRYRGTSYASEDAEVNHTRLAVEMDGCGKLPGRIENSRRKMEESICEFIALLDLASGAPSIGMGERRKLEKDGKHQLRGAS